MTRSQHQAINRAFELFYISETNKPMGVDIVEHKSFVSLSFHVGSKEEKQWHDTYWHFHVGKRGALSLVQYPDYMEEYKKTGYVGIKII